MKTHPWASLAEWDEGTIELSVSKTHRIILNTMHGRVVVDVREKDVNAFTLTPGRKDFVLLKDEEPNK